MKNLMTLVPFLLLALTTKAIPVPDPQTIILVGADLTVRDAGDTPGLVDRSAREKKLVDEVKLENGEKETETAVASVMAAEEAAKEEYVAKEQEAESSPEAVTVLIEDVSAVETLSTTEGGEEKKEEDNEEYVEKNEEIVEENHEKTEENEEEEEKNEEVDGRVEAEQQKAEEEEIRKELEMEDAERMEDEKKELENQKNEEEEEKNEEEMEKNEEEMEKNEEEMEKNKEEQEKNKEEQEKNEEEQDRNQEEEDKIQGSLEGKNAEGDRTYEQGRTPVFEYGHRVPQGPIGGPAPWPWAFQLGHHDGGIDGIPQRGLIDQVGNEVWSPRSSVVPIYVIRFDPRYVPAPNSFHVA